MSRTASQGRETQETTIRIELDLDGSGQASCTTGLPFFDHMIENFGKHAGFDLNVFADGDLEVDAHHTVEDVGILLGSAIGHALGDKRGIRRFASIRVPLDEAAVECILDLSGRPFMHYDVNYPGEQIFSDPPFDPQMMEEFWRAVAMSSGITLHIDLIRGKNTHHIIEASVKAAARAFRDAVRVDNPDGEIPSTKGTL